MKRILKGIEAFVLVLVLASCPAQPGISLCNKSGAQILVSQGGDVLSLLNQDQEVGLKKSRIQLKSKGKYLEFVLDPNFLTHLDLSNSKNRSFSEEVRYLPPPRKFVLVFKDDRLAVGYFKSGKLRDAINQPNGFPLYSQ